MTEFTSEVKTILHSDTDVFRVLSDLRKLELVKDKIPEDKLKDFSFDEDSVSFRVDPVGTVTFLVVERELNKLVKFKSDKLPFDVFLWIQLIAKGERDTRLRMTVKADLNPFIRGMVEKPMKEAVDKISDMLAQLPYDQI
ncbi:SRPBCC family protein [Proteiniphilum sp.]|uniref:SRPBCC family protein n=1 Tax=Proteiniphilum sp. TaxID=1926877 RepID=UPI002B20CF2A|nr:SRPBCC family protein [Proteiniphilum sp.]MEA4916724.1 SRPBCC family protein [Proteiniphilum sp.]